ncbi:unnamed protein product [Mytilus coruscus]|uniref:DUF4371 domain-containing protein n=1 Tax=Mytilus coruscus TaxID=42192 RepID=A0A6J8AD64_MYTCO|nr:unnamed protein product [Mytilus coruscus]
MFGMIGFRDWKNASGDKRGSLKIHENSKLHSAAKEKADNFIMVSNESKPDIYSSLSKAYENKVVRNRQILLAIKDGIVSLEQRNIALRGNWDKELKRKTSQCPHYLSPKVQNELIYCCEIEIREKIVNDCKLADVYSVCADDTTDVSVKE